MKLFKKIVTYFCEGYIFIFALGLAFLIDWRFIFALGLAFLICRLEILK